MPRTSDLGLGNVCVLWRNRHGRHARGFDKRRWFQLIFDVSHEDNDDNNVDLDLDFSWCDADGVRTMRRKWLDWRDDLCGGFHL